MVFQRIGSLSFKEASSITVSYQLFNSKLSIINCYRKEFNNSNSAYFFSKKLHVMLQLYLKLKVTQLETCMIPLASTRLEHSISITSVSNQMSIRVPRIFKNLSCMSGLDFKYWDHGKWVLFSIFLIENGPRETLVSTLKKHTNAERAIRMFTPIANSPGAILNL